LISEEIEKIIAEQKGILSIEKIPSLNSTKIKISPKKAYLMGAIFTDGNIRISSKMLQLLLFKNLLPTRTYLLTE